MLHRCHYDYILHIDGYFPEYCRTDGLIGPDHYCQQRRAREHAVYRLGRLGGKTLHQDLTGDPRRDAQQCRDSDPDAGL